MADEIFPPRRVHAGVTICALFMNKKIAFRLM
jgi:hypothetical protein